MVINWYGEGCFKIQSGQVTILTDPFESSSGLTPPRFRTDIILKTLVDYPLPYNHAETPAILGPGAYEIKGVEIFGWPIGNGQSAKRESQSVLKTIYLVKVEDLNLGFLGHISAMPDAAIIEELGEVDLLFAPAGGAPYITQEAAAKLIKQISPKIVVASFFKIPGLKRKADDIKEFLKELGQKAEPAEKLTIKKKDLPGNTQVVVLKV